MISLFRVAPDGFYQTPNSMATKAIRAKLTAADWALWSYLQMIDPFIPGNEPGTYFRQMLRELWSSGYDAEHS